MSRLCSCKVVVAFQRSTHAIHSDATPFFAEPAFPLRRAISRGFGLPPELPLGNLQFMQPPFRCGNPAWFRRTQWAGDTEDLR
jgi:hypothetical protein